MTTEICHVFLATDVKLEHGQHLELTENIQILRTPVSDAIKLAREGQIKDGFSALALLMCESRLREIGYL